MKLSRLYSNRPGTFAPVSFVDGLNVVLAEIRLPENKAKDTHNLGKTTLGRVIDFCLLSKRDPGFFLFKHADRFGGFVFFLEVELLDRSFVTVRRSVDGPTKLAFKRHHAPHSDFSDRPEGFWDHYGVPFDKAKDLLDGLLDLRDLKPYPYRKLVGYLLRSQDDFRDVFQLRKFAAAHADWKPFLARVLGFDAAAVASHYAKEEELAKKRIEEQHIRAELGGSVADLSKVEGLLLLKQKEAEKKQSLLDKFDFRQVDHQQTKTVVEELNVEVAKLNNERYCLSQNKRKIVEALDEGQILFSADEASRLFAEADVVFAGQIKKDFEQLIEFNRAITEERRAYLAEELEEVEAELARVNSQLVDLGKRRSASLSFLSGTDVFVKYRHVTDDLVTIRADIASFDRQRGFLKRLQDLRALIRGLFEEKTHLQTRIESDVEQQNTDKDSLFSSIRLYFSEIVEEVIARKALLSASPNEKGHLEFRAEILDDSGNTTSADRGFTYRKLLCVAFDLALARAHLKGRYPRFVFHDGVFESLDDRKKLNLLEVMRAYAEMGIQQVITVIRSDVPDSDGVKEEVFENAEVVLRLHDEDEAGRLFKMSPW
jgi:uncharacterized protein YydD (DUF2326 family)